MRTMYDCAYLPYPAPRYDIAAGYLISPGISHPWSTDDWRRAGTASRWLAPIAGAWPPFGDARRDVASQRAQMTRLGFPRGVTVFLDIEHMVAAQAQGYVDRWADAVTRNGDVPVIYTSATDRGLFHHKLWLAEWHNDRQPFLLPGTVATQYVSPSTDPSLAVDLSLVVDELPFWDLSHPIERKPVRRGPTYAGMANRPQGDGYWVVGSDGAVYSFGNAGYHGGANQGGKKLNRPIVGIEATTDGEGYWLIAEDGGVFSYGTAKFYGSVPGIPKK